jgi:ribosomal protein S12 methylthiotransferase
MNAELIHSPIVGVASCCNGEFNRPGTELLIGLCHQAGLETTTQIPKADAIIVNTCAFLENGEIRTGQIIDEIKKNSKPEAKLYLSGCLIAKYSEIIIKQILPEFAGYYRNHQEVNIIYDLAADFHIPITNPKIPNPSISQTNGNSHTSEHNCQNNCPVCVSKRFTSQLREICYPKEPSFLPISDGCNFPCTYCNLPLYRGKLKSRSLYDINLELNNLINQGVTNISLNGLETTSYGQDLDIDIDITDVIRLVDKNPRIREIGITLAHPAGFSEKLLKSIKYTPKIKRLEIPIQHINNEILKSMNRGITKEQLITLLTRLKNDRPDIQIFSTFIVGFPGETDEIFQELVEFLEEGWFEQFGAFAYSPEKDTIAATYDQQIPRNIRNQRRIFIQSHFPQKGWASLNEVPKETTFKERLQEPYEGYFRADSPYLLFIHQKAGRKDLILNPMLNLDIGQIWNQLFETLRENPMKIDWVMQFIYDNFTKKHILECIEEFSLLETDESLKSANQQYIHVIKLIVERLKTG